MARITIQVDNELAERLRKIPLPEGEIFSTYWGKVFRGLYEKRELKDKT